MAFVGWLYVAQASGIGRGPITVALLFIGTLVPAALGFVNYLPMRLFVRRRPLSIPLHAPPLIAGGVWAALASVLYQPRSTVRGRVGVDSRRCRCDDVESESRLHQRANPLGRHHLQKIPKHGSPKNNLGLLDLKAGHFPQAQAHFNRALEIRPSLGTAVMNLGLLHEAQGDLDGAIDLFKQVIAGTDPDPMTQAYIDLGEAYQKKGDFDSALMAYRSAAEINHRSLDAINGVGVMLMKRGDLDHAKAWFDDALQIDPFFLPAHVNLGNLLFEQGDFVAAQEEYATVLKSDRNNVAALNGMGLIAALGRVGSGDPVFQPGVQARSGIYGRTEEPDRSHPSTNGRRPRNRRRRRRRRCQCRPKEARSRESG